MNYNQRILIGIFINLYKQGHSEISLVNKNMEKYVSKLEYIFSSFNIKESLFIKDPQSETYDEFQSFLIYYLYGNHLAGFNKYYKNEILKELDKYKELIELSSYVLSNDIKIQNIKIKKRN